MLFGGLLRGRCLFAAAIAFAFCNSPAMLSRLTRDVDQRLPPRLTPVGSAQAATILR